MNARNAYDFLRIPLDDKAPTMDDAIIIADGSRGWRSTRYAASILRDNVASGYLTPTGNSADGLSVELAEMVNDEDHMPNLDGLTYTRTHDGLSMYVVEDGDIWLIPVGVDFPSI